MAIQGHKEESFVKKLIVSMILLVCFLALFFNAAQASTYAYGSIGNNYEKTNFSLAIRSNDDGFELGFGFYDFPGLLKYPCPHNNYEIVNNKYFDMICGIDYLRYSDFTDHLSVYGGIGAYMKGYQIISQSNATGWYYQEDTINEFTLAYSGGIQYHSANGIGVGIGYHSVRGANIQVIFFGR